MSAQTDDKMGEQAIGARGAGARKEKVTSVAATDAADMVDELNRRKAAENSLGCNTEGVRTAHAGVGTVVVPRAGDMPSEQGAARAARAVAGWGPYIAQPAAGDVASFSSTRVRSAIAAKDADAVRTMLSASAAPTKRVGRGADGGGRQRQRGGRAAAQWLGRIVSIAIACPARQANTRLLSKGWRLVQLHAAANHRKGGAGWRVLIV